MKAFFAGLAATLAVAGIAACGSVASSGSAESGTSISTEFGEVKVPETPMLPEDSRNIDSAWFNS